MSLDDIVGAGEQCGRNFKAERLGGFQIDHECESGRLIDRDVARFGPVEDLVHVIGRAPPEVAKVGLVGHQSQPPPSRGARHASAETINLGKGQARSTLSF